MHYFHNFQIFVFFFFLHKHVPLSTTVFSIQRRIPSIDIPKKNYTHGYFHSLDSRELICLVIFNNSPLDQSISSHTTTNPT